MLLALFFLVLWLVAEFRWGRSFRIGLGVVCMLYPILVAFTAASSEDVTSLRFQMALSDVDELLHRGQEADVHRALKAYDDAYKKTGRADHAINTMNVILYEGLNSVAIQNELKAKNATQRK